MKKIFYIWYWDKFYNNKTTIIKAKNVNDAEDRFYKNNPYTLIKKISLNAFE